VSAVVFFRATAAAMLGKRIESRIRNRFSPLMALLLASALYDGRSMVGSGF
jgi:hypothetical protein